MEINNPTQPINPSEPPIQPVPIPINKHRGILPIILGALLLLVLATGGAYYLGNKNTKATQTSNIATKLTQAPITTYITPTNYCLSPDCQTRSIFITQPTTSSSPSLSVAKPTKTLINISTAQAARDIESIEQILNKEYYGEAPVKVNAGYFDDGKYISGNVHSNKYGDYEACGGGVTCGDSGELLAAKVNSIWQIIQAFGQQEPWCAQLTNCPDFPKSELPTCYDKNGRSVNR